MDTRIVKLSQIESAVNEIYNKYRNMEADGEVDPRLNGVAREKFGISVMPADGRRIDVGDIDVASPLGGIAKIPLFATLRMQRESNPEKEHGCKCALKERQGDKPERMPVSVYGVRMASAIQPVGDPEGKWDAMMGTVNAMMSEPPQLDYALYESRTKTNSAADVENAMMREEFYLFDDAPMSIDLFTKLTCMQATTRQLAEMGATLAAGGTNPVTGTRVLDRMTAAKTVAFMAAKGPHHLSLPWIVKSGMPAKNSFGGAMLGVLPGVMSIAAYSPQVTDDGVSVKAFKAIHHIMKHLNLNAFAGENIVVE